MKWMMLAVTFVMTATASDRFPRPEFQSGYVIPSNDVGTVRAMFLYYVDVAVLFAALCVAAWLVLKKRSRKGVMALMLFSVAYFGFYKSGCICSIGSIQNIAAGIFSNYAVSVTVFLIFALPLVFALFFGRVFCSGVCPMGALQDIAALKPKRVPAHLSAVLKIIPHVFLGIAILFAAAGAGFPVCKLDPFAGIFRLSAPVGMMIFGISLLIAGIFIARPYCRYICPYGVLLGWAARISKHNVKICPGKCVNCRLCENACPVDAIQLPATEPVKEERSRAVRRLKAYIILLPIWIIAGIIVGWFLSEPISSFHPDIKLLRVIEREESGAAHEKSLESEALRVDAEVTAALKTLAGNAQKHFKRGTPILGAYLGMVIGIYLIRRSRYKKRDTYEAAPMSCVSCGRCYGYCPKQLSTTS